MYYLYLLKSAINMKFDEKIYMIVYNLCLCIKNNYLLYYILYIIIIQ